MAYNESRKRSTYKWRGKNREKYNQYMREYRKKNLERLRSADIKRYQAAKAEAIATYGGKCVCCGESQFEFLTLDHYLAHEQGRRHTRTGPNGKKHRAYIRGHTEYARLKNLGWPDIVRVLCMNCNWVTQNGKTCPHPNGVTGYNGVD